MSVPPEEAPDQPTFIDIDFEQGVPVGLNGKKMAPLDLLTELKQNRRRKTPWAP
jgi:argininosuccinate synthase